MKNSILTFRGRIKYLDYVVGSRIIPPKRRVTEIIIPITFSVLPDYIEKIFGISSGNNYHFIIRYRSFVYDNDRKRRGNIINFLKYKIKNVFISIFPDNYLTGGGDILFEKEEYISSDECKKLLSDFYNLIKISTLDVDFVYKKGQNLALTIIEKIKD